VRHAMMREMSHVERVGQIIEIGQRIWNLELPGLFGHETLSNHFYWFRATDTTIERLLVFDLE